MVWDLGKAMRKKEEFESARLMDFEFRQRARAARLMARRFNLAEDELVQAIAVHNDAGLIGMIAEQSGQDEATVAKEFARCWAAARQELIAERGDPSPHRLG